ncbi:hypothetical protein D9M69_389970 [compost metagenome]
MDDMDTAAAEKLFFDAHGVKVTNARFIVSKQTYAMASVNSVKVGVTNQTPSKSGAAISCIVGGLMLLMASSNLRELWGLAVVGAGALSAGVLWLRSIKPKFEYKLILTTSSGETTALSSFSESDIRVVETALNDAIIYRG